MQKLSEIYKYTDKTVMVIAAGPSAKADVMVRHDIAVGINHHSDYYLHCTDYNVFMDTPDRLHPTNPQEFIEMVNTPGKRVCPRSGFTDYEFDVPYPDRGFTAPLAVWFGLWITSGKVLLAGFDLWQSRDEQTHFYKHTPEATRHLGNLKFQLGIWEDFFNTIDKERLTALSGPLMTIL